MLNGSANGGLLNTLKTADKLGVTPKTLRNWLKSGKCPVAPVPGMKPPRWRSAEIETFLTGDATA